MHYKDNNFGSRINVSGSAYQGAGLSAGAASAGAAVDLEGQRSFKLVAHFAGTTGSPTTASATFALESSANGSTGWHAVNDRDGNAVTLAVTAAQKVNSVDVDTQYFTVGDAYIRVTPTVAFTGGTAPTASFVASLVMSSQERM